MRALARMDRWTPVYQLVTFPHFNLQPEMSSKKGTVLPKKATVLPMPRNREWRGVDYAGMVSAALRVDLGQTRHTAKIVMRWTVASESGVKNWFAGTKGPSGEHLCDPRSAFRFGSEQLPALVRTRARPIRSKANGGRAKLSEVLELVSQLADSDQ
jgi:hypothetical protein